MKWFLVVVLLCPISLRADQFDDALTACKGNSNESHCSAEVLLGALRSFTQGGGGMGTSNTEYCQCVSDVSDHGVMVATLYYTKGTGALALASGISPSDCVQALRAPPCWAP